MGSLTTRTVLVLGASVLLAPPASAQQPLAEFLAEGARGGALAAREAQVTAASARAQVDEARARLLPSIAVTASYLRNQYDAIAELPTGETDGAMRPITRRAVITPADQLEGRVTLTVPLLDVSAWSSFFGAESTADAADQRAMARAIDARVEIVTAYHALVAARAVCDAAARTLAAAEENLAVVSARAAPGLVSELDRQRAIVDVERSRQSVAEAELAEVVAARSLFVASGLEPSEARATLDARLDEEPPLERWAAAARESSAVRAAQLDVRAAELARDSAWQQMLPVVAATASERLTNATGFNGQDATWAIGLTATWTLDFGRPAVMGLRDRQLELAQLRARRALIEAETAILEAWQGVRSRIARARAARVAEEASARAAEVARARYEAGTGTQLEVSQSERDRFAAEVARIQADADLVVARLVLRLRSGLEPDLEEVP